MQPKLFKKYLTAAPQILANWGSARHSLSRQIQSHDIKFLIGDEKAILRFDLEKKQIMGRIGKFQCIKRLLRNKSTWLG